MSLRPEFATIFVLFLQITMARSNGAIADEQHSLNDLHVNPATGNDANHGLAAAPVKTIARAIRLAQPGDTVHLTPGVYYVSADLTSKHGLPGKPITLDDANIRYPARSSAIVQSHAGSHLTVRNITGTHVYNDGYNVHGAQRNLIFENITAIECGDDGFSAHEDADCQIEGFTSIRNATGLCDTGTSQTHYKNVFISECNGFDLYFIGQTHSVENAMIESSAARSFWLDGNRLADGNLCEVWLKNVIIRRADETEQELRIGKGGRLRASQCTFLNLNVTLTPGGSVDFRRCVVGGDRKAAVLIFPNTIWSGENNVYDFKSLRVAQTSFTKQTFADFQKLTGSEADSRWEAVPGMPSDIGANLKTRQPLRGI